jgi:squalene cyclase
MQLLGLYWAGAGQNELQRLVKTIVATERPDGGWAQGEGLGSDAYATGQTLFALAEAGGMSPAASAYRRGVGYLLSTQRGDGSWHVRSRAPKFQPYFESGFPYGHDQWISSMATGWAALALAHAAE